MVENIVVFASQIEGRCNSLTSMILMLGVVFASQIEGRCNSLTSMILMLGVVCASQIEGRCNEFARPLRPRVGCLCLSNRRQMQPRDSS